MESKTAVIALGALAHDTRLHIFRLLVKAGVEGLSVGRIAEALAVEPNGRLSFHLKELVSAGLVLARPEGRFIYYSTDYPAINELLHYLTEDCCGGQPCGEAAVACNPE